MVWSPDLVFVSKFVGFGTIELIFDLLFNEFLLWLRNNQKSNVILHFFLLIIAKRAVEFNHSI